MVLNIKARGTISAVRLPAKGHGLPREPDIEKATGFRRYGIQTKADEAKIDEALKVMDAEIKDLPMAEKRRWAKRKDRALRQKTNLLRDEFRDTSQKINKLNDLIAAYRDLESWANGFLTFQRPASSFFQDFRKAIADATILDMRDLRTQPTVEAYDEEVFENANIFVVEHDWVGAVGRAEEFADGSFRLPYDTCIFEFTVTGKQVVAIACNYSESASDKGMHNEIVLQLGVRSLIGWTISPEIYRHSHAGWAADFAPVSRHMVDDPFQRLVRLIGDQMRAASIALDAEAATSELVRESHIGRKSSDRSALPDYSYHVIKLAKRSRATSFGDGDCGSRRRLHFRRGHWRHYESHKTWIRWMLVGDPDLGFVDKDYRL